MSRRSVATLRRDDLRELAMLHHFFLMRHDATGCVCMAEAASAGQSVPTVAARGPVAKSGKYPEGAEEKPARRF
jgi:hypothetical protein